MPDRSLHINVLNAGEGDRAALAPNESAVDHEGVAFEPGQGGDASDGAVCARDIEVNMGEPEFAGDRTGGDVDVLDAVPWDEPARPIPDAPREDNLAVGNLVAPPLPFELDQSCRCDPDEN